MIFYLALTLALALAVALALALALAFALTLAMALIGICSWFLVALSDDEDKFPFEFALTGMLASQWLALALVLFAFPWIPFHHPRPRPQCL